MIKKKKDFTTALNKQQVNRLSKSHDQRLFVSGRDSLTSISGESEQPMLLPARLLDILSKDMAKRFSVFHTSMLKKNNQSLDKKTKQKQQKNRKVTLVMEKRTCTPGS